MSFITAIIYAIISLVSVYQESPAVQTAVDRTIFRSPESTIETVVFNISEWTPTPTIQYLTDNDKPLVSLTWNTYKKTFLAPGTHALATQDKKLVLNAVSGIKYYIVMGVNPPRNRSFTSADDPVVIRQISEKEAKPLLQDLKEVN